MAITRVAACHVTPHFLSATQTTAKAVSLIHQAAKQKAQLVVFPESYIAAFPLWSALRPPTENHSLFERMVAQSIAIDGDEVAALRTAARETHTVVSMGISERSPHSIACLYNTNLLIDHTGDIVIYHRKLVPTFFEKLTWSPGDGYGLRVADTPAGRISALICGENTNPLARYALMAQRQQIHISSWPCIWPTRVLDDTADAASRNYDNVLANRLRAAAHCFEAKCFGVMCSGVLDEGAIEMLVDGAREPECIRRALVNSPRGVSMFLDPTGATVEGWTVDEASGEVQKKEFLQAEEGILYADLDLSLAVEGKQYHDVVGGYQRLDIFDLRVDRTRREPEKFSDGDEA
ncbi:carbon-nitrogen hydrolase family protein [Aspergillus ibericus CBS 121593]|uniref:Nitrilase n=1 Tax=Aspergillus ibericus CBS 121593 TaxID=1448316 RepID=A0A395H843_9EURO|nr:nitrilase [Aspergillus ibericus CBS 121593]RAL03315.1 nitrilase [Aspergillus ibericus CBS 121593]